MPTRKAIDKLKSDLIIMGEMCENSVSSAIMALVDRDAEIAQQTIDYDREIDEMELAVDADCMRLFAEGRLEGANLRFVAAAMKINNDLERIGDLSVEVCEHVVFLAQRRSVLSQIVDFTALVDQISQIIQESIRSLVEHDNSLAWKIIDEHLVVQDEITVIYAEVLDIMRESPRTIERCTHILGLCKALERVADLATNVAEEVVFMVEGKNVRHHITEYRSVVSEEKAVESGSEGMAEHESSLVKRHTRRLERKRKTVRRRAAARRE
jgi:phosphate transport system protein